MYERIAYLTEDCNVDDRGPVATGLFSCFVDWAADESPPGEVAGDVADSLPLAEALRWARARTDRVAVRIACEGGYSAGRVPLPDPPLDESRQLGPRRLTGWEFLDRTDVDPPIVWDVIVEVNTPAGGRIARGGEPTELGERWRDALDLSASCQVVEMTATGTDGRITTEGNGWTGHVTTPAAVLRVNAGGYEGAIQVAVRAAADAAAAVGWEPAPAFSANHAFATDSDAARRNAHVDATGIRS